MFSNYVCNVVVLVFDQLHELSADGCVYGRLFSEAPLQCCNLYHCVIQTDQICIVLLATISGVLNFSCHCRYVVLHYN